jgi:hypothetical protein
MGLVPRRKAPPDGVHQCRDVVVTHLEVRTNIGYLLLNSIDSPGQSKPAKGGVTRRAEARAGRPSAVSAQTPAAPPASPGAEAGRPARLAPGPAKRDSPILLRFCRRCFRAETFAQRPDQPWPSRRNRRSLRPRPRRAQGPGRGERRQRRRSGGSQLGL